MKTFLILVLSLCLVAAAFMTRPGKREYVLYLVDKEAEGDNSPTDRSIDRALSATKNVTFHNRVLWTDIEKDGKVVYSGFFAHWFPRGEQAEKPEISVKGLAKILSH